MQSPQRERHVSPEQSTMIRRALPSRLSSAFRRFLHLLISAPYRGAVVLHGGGPTPRGVWLQIFYASSLSYNADSTPSSTITPRAVEPIYNAPTKTRESQMTLSLTMSFIQVTVSIRINTYTHANDAFDILHTHTKGERQEGRPIYVMEVDKSHPAMLLNPKAVGIEDNQMGIITPCSMCCSYHMPRAFFAPRERRNSVDQT